MTVLTRALFITLILFLTACQNLSEFSVMTYNIRLDIAADRNNAWPYRKGLLIAQLHRTAPDVFGVQEALPHQMEFINRNMPDHAFIGQGRDGANKGEYSAVFYDRKLFSVEKEKTFWLSETPHKKSLGWDAAYPRICSYGLFTHVKTNKKIWVFNTHLDHIGTIARQEGLALILKKVNAVNTENYPVILMGDFNATLEGNLITSLTKQMNDTKAISRKSPQGPNATFNAFKSIALATRRIDYIMLSKSPRIDVNSYAVIHNATATKYPSDHFPVVVTLAFNN